MIAELWRELEQTSVVLTAERRMGKTCVVKKMHRESPGPTTFFQDLERVHTALEFVEEVLRHVRDQLSKGKKAALKFQDVLKAVGGTEVGGVLTLPEGAQPQWKALLVSVVDDLMVQQTGAVVFFWDEFPQMLHNVAKDKPGDAMEILDTLRSLRQHHERLRMVLTGSIGLHTVLHLLQRRGHRSAPKNDMVSITLPPLARADAEALALALLRGESIQAEEPEAVASDVAVEAGYIPFYIHQVVGEMRGREAVVVGTARTLVDQGLTAPHDPWGLRHYRVRLDHDYEDEERVYALAVLHALSLSDAPLGFPELMARVKAQPGVVDEERARTVLNLLQQDHYLVRENGRYSFRTPLIGRWWRRYHHE
ncbi:MAG TPA: AAA family ATPase [Longimicrobiaceae bacterium]